MQTNLATILGSKNVYIFAFAIPLYLPFEKTAKEIQECREPFEDPTVEKQNKLQLLDNHSSAFSNNKVIQLKNLPLGPYNIMAMREAQTQFGQKYIMLLVTDQNGTLGLCCSNKEIERFMRKNLTDEQKVKIRDPKRNYLTLFGKPLAVLNILDGVARHKDTLLSIVISPRPQRWRKIP